MPKQLAASLGNESRREEHRAPGRFGSGWDRFPIRTRLNCLPRLEFSPSRARYHFPKTRDFQPLQFLVRPVSPIPKSVVYISTNGGDRIRKPTVKVPHEERRIATRIFIAVSRAPTAPVATPPSVGMYRFNRSSSTTTDSRCLAHTQWWNARSVTKAPLSDNTRNSQRLAPPVTSRIFRKPRRWAGAYRITWAQLFSRCLARPATKMVVDR
jgi:hypothetical protein